MTNIKAKQVSAGFSGIALIYFQNNVRTFYNDTYRQLSLGDYQNRYILILILIPNFKAQQVSASINLTAMIETYIV